jgi:hypothetical protein
MLSKTLVTMMSQWLTIERKASNLS